MRQAQDSKCTSELKKDDRRQTLKSDVQRKKEAVGLVMSVLKKKGRKGWEEWIFDLAIDNGRARELSTIAYEGGWSSWLAPQELST